MAYFDEGSGVCIECPTIHLLVSHASIGLALITAAAAIIYAIFKFPPRQLVSTSLTARRVWLKLGELGLRAKVKLLIVYLQIAFDIPDVYGINMPELYRRRMRDAFAWIKFDYSQALVPGQCLAGGIADRLAIRGLAPLALMMLIIIACVLKELHIQFAAKRTPPSDAVAGLSRRRIEVRSESFISQRSTEHLMSGHGASSRILSAFATGVGKGLPVILFLSFSLCPAVSAGIFSVWNCEGFEDNSGEKTTKLYMRDDLSVRCSTPEHAQEVYEVITAQAYMCESPIPRTHNMRA